MVSCSHMTENPITPVGYLLALTYFKLFFSVIPQSQAEAHYKGNRHARRVKGIETSKSRPQEGDKAHTIPPTSSPSPPGASGTVPDCETGKAGKKQKYYQDQKLIKCHCDSFCKNKHLNVLRMFGRLKFAQKKKKKCKNNKGF